MSWAAAGGVRVRRLPRSQNPKLWGVQNCKLVLILENFEESCLGDKFYLLNATIYAQLLSTHYMYQDAKFTQNIFE